MVRKALLRINNLVVGALALDNRKAIALPDFWVWSCLLVTRTNLWGRRGFGDGDVICAPVLNGVGGAGGRVGWAWTGCGTLKQP